jgi:predicted dehydrogenase
MIDAAIIGLGWWGRRHVEAARDTGAGLRYVLGVTHEPDEIADFAAEQRLPIATDYAVALADPAIRAVVLATPHTLHPAQVEAAAEAGKHVFCEKPFALDVGDAARAVAACRRAGVVLGVGHDWRYRPALVEIKRMIEAGELGTVMQVEANYSHDILADVPPGTWRADAAEAPAGGMTAWGYTSPIASSRYSARCARSMPASPTGFSGAARAIPSPSPSSSPMARSAISAPP